MNRFAVALLGTALATGCGPGGLFETDSASRGIAVRGRWAPPPDVVRIANAQFVPVVDPPPVYPQGRCSGPDPLRHGCTHPVCTQAHPGTTEIANYILNRWPTTINSGVYGCRRNTNNTAYLSVHAVGRAIDISVPLSRNDADNTLGDEIGNWLITNAEHIGIQRVGWDGKWFNGERGFGASMCSRSCGESDFPYGCWPCNPHVDHLHIEVSVDAANRRTRFFTEGAPGQMCPEVCYGTAAVATDCSFVDCAATGQVCLPNPVRCESAAPPEPPMATHHPNATMPSVATVGPPARLSLVGPARVFDTRPTGDSSRLLRGGATGPLLPGTIATVETFPLLPAPATGAWLNLAVVNGAGPGFVRAFAAGAPSDTSSLNYQPNTVRSNAAPTPFGARGGISFEAVNAGTDLVGDLIAAFTPTGMGLRSVAPRRILDTRDTPDLIPAETPFIVNVNAPMNATGVVASVAVINGEAGFVRAYACDEPMPDTSSINYEGEGVVTNTVVSKVSASGDLCFWSIRPVELIVDITGYLTTDGELSYQPLQPVRLLDTRESDALYRGRLGSGQVVELPIQPLAGAPAGIQSVVVNLTATESDSAGFITVYPCGFAPPLTSALNFGAARGAVGTVAVTSIGLGKLCLRAHNRSHVVVDLLGVWVPTPGGVDPSPSVPPDEVDPTIPGEGADGGADAGEADDSGAPDVPTTGPDTGVADAGVAADAGPGPGADAGAGAATDAGVATDAAAARDAAMLAPAVDSSCGCTAGDPSRGGPSWGLLLPLAVLFGRRRRTPRSARGN